MNRAVFVMVGSLVALVALVLLLPSDSARRPVAQSRQATQGQSSENEVLTIYCAAANRAVMEAIRTDYEAEFGVALKLQYGASQTLLSNLEIGGTADLYLPADDSYLAAARHKGLVDEVLPVAEMQAVLAVSKEAAVDLPGLDALLASSLRIVQANPEAAAVGKLTRDMLTAQGKWEALAARTQSFKGTVHEVANDVQIGAADVGIVFDAVLHTIPQLKAVPLPELAEAKARIAVGVAASTAQPQRALHFARYLAAPEKGQRRYEEYGYRPLPGDPWADTPELTLYAGAMLRPAIEETLREFEEREGVRVVRKYNGCGILVAQMRAGEVPDAYFACDSEFMQQVRDLFPTHTDVSQNELVILVPKGNPRRIASLQDLTQPGLRVGIGHEKQCAMGWLTQRTLRESGVQADVMNNVIVQSPTGDMLVNQMQTGSLDAAVAYLSNAAGAAQFLDAVRIQGIPCSIATQPYAVARSARYPQLAERLLARLRSAESEKQFTQLGFAWKVPSAGKALAVDVER
jgi:molybdenum ABC transporter molybdate-binding protein